MSANNIIAAAIFLSTGAAIAKPSPPIALIDLTVPFSAGTVPRGVEWLGLFCDKQVCQLRNAKVSIADRKDGDEPAASDEEASAAAKGEPVEAGGSDETALLFDDIEVDGGPLALFSGTRLVPGMVTTWHATHPLQVDPATLLSTIGHWTIPGGPVPMTMSRAELPDDKGYRYHLSDGVTRQFLFAVPRRTEMSGETIIPTIHWAGDLDGDGKLDLVISAGYECTYDERLYLSSRASKTDFVALAATLQGTHTNCGC